MSGELGQDTPRREIAIFWDFENVRDFQRIPSREHVLRRPGLTHSLSMYCIVFVFARLILQVQLPSWASPADASKAIVSAVSKYGRIVDRRLYFDMAQQQQQQQQSSLGTHHWSALDSSGFDLVNTPRRNQKETLDKKMIADILTFAWDSAVRNDNCKPCVVLLTSDGDYAYTLSKLRDRGVMSVVMHGNNSTTAQILKSAADIPLDFQQDVLKKPNTAFGGGSPSRFGGGGSTGVFGQPSQSKNTFGGGTSTFGNLTAPAPAGGIFGSTSTNNTTNAFGAPASRSLFSTGSFGHDSSSGGMVDELSLARMLCQAIVSQPSQHKTDEGWILGAKVAIAFQIQRKQSNDYNNYNNNNNNSNNKENYKQAREVAIRKGWLQQGRKVLSNDNISKDVIVVTSGVSSNDIVQDPNNLSKEDYLRVTLLGTNQSSKQENSMVSLSSTTVPTATQQCKTKLFLKNLPIPIRILDVVRTLEKTHNIIVLRGHTLRSQPGIPWLYAQIEVATEEQADRLIQAAKDNRVLLHGRPLSVEYLKESSKPYRVDPEFCYERAKISSTSTNIGNGNGHKEDVTIYCMALAQHIRNRINNANTNTAMYKTTPLVEMDGWSDAGFTALAGTSLLSGDKERIKKARANAVLQNYIQVGRRLKTSSFDGTDRVTIEVTTSTVRDPRYATELYVRLTPQGTEWVQQHSHTVSPCGSMDLGSQQSN